MIGARCKHCTEAIGWVRTASGQRMPVDLISCNVNDDENTLFDPARHKSHFATCPGADTARKPRKKREDRWGPPKV